jgi:hypothetical protein
MPEASNRARIEAYIGASGSGKGVSIKRRLAALAPARLLVWDARDEYSAHALAVRTLPELVQRVTAAGPAGGFRVRYVPGAGVKLADAFGVLCRLAFREKNLVLLAEELSDVTSASWAPPAWRQCITQGRHHGLHILGATQRPALVDKTFLANCTLVRCGVLGYRADRNAMAAELDCDPGQLAALESAETTTGARLQMLERDRDRRRLELVTVNVFRGGRTTEDRRKVAGLSLR